MAPDPGTRLVQPARSMGEPGERLNGSRNRYHMIFSPNEPARGLPDAPRPTLITPKQDGISLCRQLEFR